MNQNINALREWLNLYDREGLGGPPTTRGTGIYGDQMGAGDGRAGARMFWAQSMLRGMDGAGGRQRSPNFFADEGGDPFASGAPAYVAPEIPMERPMPARREMPTAMNYFATLKGGR